MTPFRFRLEALLRIRRSARDEGRRHLAQALDAQSTLERNVHAVDQELLALKERARQAARPGAVDLDHLIQAQRYEATLGGQRRLFAQQQQQLTAEIERRREALLAADRQVRVLEHLRDRQHQCHHAQHLRREAKELDELAGRRRQDEGTC
jgi:flagellar export protein FliJ